MENNEHYSLYLNTLNIQNLYDKNQANLIKAYKAQNNNSFGEALNFLEEIKNNFYLLGNIIDKTNHGPLLCRENREILSVKDIKKYLKDNPSFKFVNNSRDMFYNENFNISNKKQKQHKSKWTKEEEDKFNEGLAIYGKKSK